MSQPSEPRELSSTYFVQDRSSDEERKRVQMQDAMYTKRLGGVLPEQPEPISFQRVIDIGCGTGGWLVEVAKTYPQIKLLIGADISHRMVEYARKLAHDEQVDDRVEFHVMDALRMIEFPKHYFDLINQRLGLSYLRTWDWPNLFQKYQYAARNGAVIRLTESDVFGETNSPALTKLFALAREAFYRAGHMFTPERTGVTSELPGLMQRTGFYDVEQRQISLHYNMNTPEMEAFREDMKLTFRTIVPFLRKWTLLPENYEALYQEALREMQDPGFTADWDTVTVWGKNPPQ